jgi:hypothetical protein
VGIDVDNEIIRAFFFGGVREDVARVGVDCDLRKLTHLWQLFPVFGSVAVGFLAVLRLMRRALEHRVLQAKE